MSTVFKDINGNELRLGDYVATTSGHYRDLVVAQIVGFTPKMIKIQNTRRKTYAEKYDVGYTLKGEEQVSLIYSRATVNDEIERLREQVNRLNQDISEASWKLENARNELDTHERRNTW